MLLSINTNISQSAVTLPYLWTILAQVDRCCVVGRDIERVKRFWWFFFLYNLPHCKLLTTELSFKNSNCIRIKVCQDLLICKNCKDHLCARSYWLQWIFVCKTLLVAGIFCVQNIFDCRDLSYTRISSVQDLERAKFFSVKAWHKRNPLISVMSDKLDSISVRLPEMWSGWKNLFVFHPKVEKYGPLELRT